MTNDDKDLKPCPFCGDTKYLRVTYQDSKANASITGDKKYWGVFCMEKCGASIDSIYPTREEAIRVWNTRATPQQPSEPLKQIVVMGGFNRSEIETPDEVLENLFNRGYNHGVSGGMSEDGESIAVEESKEMLSKFGQPSEKKVLSVEDMKKIMWDLENKWGYQPAYETIAQAIHSALPARKEVKWPEKREVNGLLANQMLSKKWNEAIDACIAAYEEAIPAQREVRYPEKRYCRDGEHGLDCRECADCFIHNNAIDEFKKLNGDKT